MTKIKTEATFGNFKWTAEGEFETPVLEELAAAGLLQVLQRGPASAAEKAMAGYEKRPAGFKRDSIAFSQEHADTLETTFERAELEVGGKKYALGLVVAVEEYKGAEAAEKKYAAAKKIVVGKEKDPTKLGTLAEKVGFEYEDESELTEENIEFLKAIDEYIKAI